MYLGTKSSRIIDAQAFIICSKYPYISFFLFGHFTFRAVVDHSMGKDLPSFSVQNLEYFPGRGLVATLDGTEVMIMLNQLIGLSTFIPVQLVGVIPFSHMHSLF